MRTCVWCLPKGEGERRCWLHSGSGVLLDLGAEGGVLLWDLELLEAGVDTEGGSYRASA